MNDVSKPERATQHRVVQLLCQELGYRNLGDWTERANNAPIEETLLTAFWQTKGYTPEQMSRALNTLRSEAANLRAAGQRTLHQGAGQYATAGGGGQVADRL